VSAVRGDEPVDACGLDRDERDDDTRLMSSAREVMIGDSIVCAKRGCDPRGFGLVVSAPGDETEFVMPTCDRGGSCCVRQEADVEKSGARQQKPSLPSVTAWLVNAAGTPSAGGVRVAIGGPGLRDCTPRAGHSWMGLH